MAVGCPRCDKGGFAGWGQLHGHLRFVHELSNEEADAVLAEEKGEGANRKPQGEPPTSDPARESDVGQETDEVDEILSRILRRREQRERIRAIHELEESEPPQPAGDRSSVDELREVVELASSMREFAAPDESVTKSDIREVVAEVGAGPVADGGSSDVLAAALESGIDDPAALEKISEIHPRTRAAERKWSVIETAISRMDGSVVGQIAELATAALNRPRERGRRGDRHGRPDRGDREPVRRPEDRGPAPEPEPEPRAREENRPGRTRARERFEESAGGAELEVDDDQDDPVPKAIKRERERNYESEQSEPTAEPIEQPEPADAKGRPEPVDAEPEGPEGDPRP